MVEHSSDRRRPAAKAGAVASLLLWLWLLLLLLLLQLVWLVLEPKQTKRRGLQQGARRHCRSG